jgi:hypothetical protein
VSGGADSVTAAIAVVGSGAVAGDAAQLPRYAWSAEVAAPWWARPFVMMRWGYDATATGSYAAMGAGLELPVLGGDALRLTAMVAPFVELGLPRNALPPRVPAFDAGLSAGPRFHIALGGSWPGAAVLVGVPVTATWTCDPSSAFVEPTRPRLGLGVGGEIGLALPL